MVMFFRLVVVGFENEEAGSVIAPGFPRGGCCGFRYRVSCQKIPNTIATAAAVKMGMINMGSAVAAITAASRMNRKA